MADEDALRALFEDKIIRILQTLLDNPSKNLSLTQIATMAAVSTATTLRILNKLVSQEFAKITIIGKSKFYRLKQGQKTLMLGRLMRKNDQINVFTNAMEQYPEVKKMILVSKTDKEAKIVLVGEHIPEDKIKAAANEVKKKFNYTIKYAQLPLQYFNDLDKVGVEDLREKIIWERS